MNSTEAAFTTGFLLSANPKVNLLTLLSRPLLKTVEHLLGLKKCQQLYDQLEVNLSAEQFPRLALEKLAVSYQLDPHEKQRIPTSGPCILIANHPFGGIEGLILLDLLSQLRPDFKVMANFILTRVPELRERLISVDPFGGDLAAQTNLLPLRQALNWLKQGGLLVIFPAGAVSSRQPGDAGIVDPAWSSTLPRLVRMSKAPVLPVFFPGHNGALFQWAGRIHPRLRTALLPRMLLNKRGQNLTVKVGNLLPNKKLCDFTSDQQLNDYLRLRTYALELASSDKASPDVKPQTRQQQPVIAALRVERLEAEIINLPEQQRLLQSGEFTVLSFHAEQAPNLLREIGRLRELTFRLAGEGTGQSIDLDQFDQDYSHLCLWNHKKREVVGAYRIGRVDELLKTKGADGLYSSTLFDFQPQLLKRLQNALELGRSFIRTEYQRSYSPLLLLWKGIGHYLVANPQYRYLFGPVSISSDYSNNSRQLMTSSLAQNFLINDLASLVTARLPISLQPLKITGIAPEHFQPLFADMEEISALVADLENDNKGIPVLLRHYLNLGGKLLAFNLDPDFGNVIDGLLLVDLPQTEPKQLQRYMGHAGYQCYMTKHRQTLDRCA